MPRLFGYIAPYFNQAKSIAWDIFKYFSNVIPGVQFNEAELRIDFPGNGRIRLFGGDNPQAMRGLKFWEVGFDEYSDIDPNVHSEIISPACIDTQAPRTFMGTIKGEDELWNLYERAINDPEWFALKLKASESGLLLPEWLEQERRLIGDAKFNQEYELEPMAAIEGAYYMNEMIQIEKEKRIGVIPYEPLYPVDTYWDLGMDDTMFLIFVQKSIEGIRIIDSYWAHGVPFKDIARLILDKPYMYGTHYLPHDGKVRSMDTGEERFKSLERYLPAHKVECLPRPKSVMDKIEASRWVFPKIYINKQTCDYLIKCLRYYRQEYDDKLKRWKDNPTHDWSSHGSDAFAYMALHARSDVFSSILPIQGKIKDEYAFTPSDEFRM